jgi:aspartate aminotransferase
MVRLSSLANNLSAESAFTVLAIARRLKSQGKDVVELEIGDSPFPSTPAAKAAGIRAIEENQTGYCPSLGLADFRAAAANAVRTEFGLDVGADNVVVASGAKPFEQYFAEALLDAGDGVLIFSPHFPTYIPNLERRGARPVIVPLLPENGFRPQAEDVARFVSENPRPRGIFLNSPHNPTGGVATRDDLAAIADIVRGTDVMVFSDEPYCHMVWQGRHESILAQPGMLENTVAAYTFSKSYSMSGWRAGFAVAHPTVVEAIGKLINTAASCSPPFVQIAAQAALEHDAAMRDEYMARFHRKVVRLARGLANIEGIKVAEPVGTFYV